MPEKAVVTETCAADSVPELKPVLEVGREQLFYCSENRPFFSNPY